LFELHYLVCFYNGTLNGCKKRLYAVCEIR